MNDFPYFALGCVVLPLGVVLFRFFSLCFDVRDIRRMLEENREAPR